MAAACAAAALPPGEGKAIPTLGCQGLLHRTELNSCEVERRRLGLMGAVLDQFF